MSKLIYQVYVGKSSKLYDHCTKSVEEYASRIGADYVRQTKPLLKIRPNPFTTNRSREAVERLGYLPIFEKENAFDYFYPDKGEFDQICIIDSDVYVRPDAPDIFDDLEDKYAFGGVVERDMPITQAYKNKIKNYSAMQYSGLHPRINFDPNNLGYEFMNMGVMVMNASIRRYLRGQTAAEFLRRPEFQDYIDGKGAWKWSTDQTLLNAWIRNSRMNFKRMDWRWNGLFGANTRIKECHFVHFFLKDKLHKKGEDVDSLMKSIQ